MKIQNLSINIYAYILSNKVDVEEQKKMTSGVFMVEGLL